MKKYATTITLYEMMGEDYSVYVRKDNEGGFDLMMDGEEIYMDEKGMTKEAMDSFADLCEQFLRRYERAKNKESSNAA